VDESVNAAPKPVTVWYCRLSSTYRLTEPVLTPPSVMFDCAVSLLAPSAVVSQTLMVWPVSARVTRRAAPGRA
jgi:hypothetical protein